MTTPAPQEVTQLLQDWRHGDKAALDQLMPIVYDELHRVAASYLRRERPDHTLQATALISEAYLRLMDESHVSCENRTHFLGVAARLMRHILVEHARSHQAAKRGGDRYKVSLSEADSLSQERDLNLLALDEALQELARLDRRQSQIVEMKYFAGLSIEEIAELLGIAPATVKRHWNSARAWLYQQIKSSDE